MSPELPERVVDWVETTCGVRVEAAATLPGATSSQVWRLQVGGQARVLRLFTNAGWLELEPDLAAHELAALRFMEPSAVPTPAGIAADEDGKRCGVPAVLMGMLPGRVALDPPSPERWLTTLADTLAHIHATSPADFPWRYRSWLERPGLAIPDWSDRPQLWERALEIVARPEPDEAPVFLHRDYHPTNVLFEGTSLSGVVDWVNACTGPAGVDLCHCRANLARMYGVEAADRFLAAYLERVPGYRYDPYWDVARVAEHLPRPKSYAPWGEFGLALPSERQCRERLEALLARALGTG